MKIISGLFCTAIFAFSIVACSKGQGPSGNDGGDTDTIPAAANGAPVESWLTRGDQSVLLAKQPTIRFGTVSNTSPFIDVDSSQDYQAIDGFGFTLTSGSADVIHTLDAAAKASLLQELFSTNTATSIGISYLRLSIGASDLSASVYSYDDMPAGQTDEALTNFSLDPDKASLLPLLKEILAINPAIKIIAAPWSPPVWMKTNGSSIGGSLKPEYFQAYANYFVKYIQAMQAEGIAIQAITPQNEPLHPGNNPSLYMPAEEQAAFIKNNLGPAFQAAGITTKIIVYDHNCNKPEYPLAILNDAAARTYVDGSAFHLYEGDISALTQVHDAYPDKNLYFTEQYTGSGGSFDGDLKWHIKNVVIGSVRNWSRVALEWNLANNAAYEPHTPGGCTTCKGALTIGPGVVRNVGYYIIAHASKFVPAGSVRISSNIQGSLQNAAFKTPGGKKVLIVENDGDNTATFNIRYKGQWATSTLAAGAVCTYVW